MTSQRALLPLSTHLPGSLNYTDRHEAAGAASRPGYKSLNHKIDSENIIFR